MSEHAEPQLGTPLRSFVEGDRRLQAAAHLEAYFRGTSVGADGRTHRLFSGALFERFAATAPQDELAHSDLTAVTALGVTVPPRAAHWLLSEGTAEVGELLRAIGPDRPIAEADADELLPRSPAARLWSLFADLPDVGPVTAGKLLAAKRPNLIPVWDQHVQAGTGAPEEQFWPAMRSGVIEDGALYKRLRAELGLDVPLLRVIDVVIWMDQHGHKYLPRSASG